MKTITIHGLTIAKRVLESVLEGSFPFSFRPLPDDFYEIDVTDDRKERVEELVQEKTAEWLRQRRVKNNHTDRIQLAEYRWEEYQFPSHVEVQEAEPWTDSGEGPDGKWAWRSRVFTYADYNDKQGEEYAYKQAAFIVEWGSPGNSVETVSINWGSEANDCPPDGYMFDCVADCKAEGNLCGHDDE